MRVIVWGANCGWIPDSAALDEKQDKLRVWVEVMVYICGFVWHVVLILEVVGVGVMLVLWLCVDTSFMLVLYFIFYRVGSLYAYVYVY